jgi:sucrose-phosphate synthase
MGNRDDIRNLDDGPAAVLTEILLLLDKYDLYGLAAVPKQHQADDVPAIYRLAAASKGVFVNPALTEPFGLTLLEAAASGLPLIATENGGPVDILRNCENGYLIDPLDPDDIAAKLLRILDDAQQWQAFSETGLQAVKQHYSWQAHAQIYLERIKPLIATQTPLALRDSSQKAGRNHLGAIVSDIDQNLLGHAEGLAAFAKALQQYRRRVSFGIVTGRNRDSALTAIRQHSIPFPDFLITSLGTEIYYTRELIYDRAWARHIDHLWTPSQIKQLLADAPGLLLQEKNHQSRFKLSYYYDAEQAPSLEEINAYLRQHEQSVSLSIAFGQFLDILPIRASKGSAMRYVAQHWDIPLEHILVAGGSGADEDMMRGNTLAVVVANRHHEELAQLEELDTIYFAEAPHALGIVEAIEHYGFFQLIEQQQAA